MVFGKKYYTACVLTRNCGMKKDEFNTRYDTKSYGYPPISSDIDCKYPGPKDDPIGKKLDDLEAKIKAKETEMTDLKKKIAVKEAVLNKVNDEVPVKKKTWDDAKVKLNDEELNLTELEKIKKQKDENYEAEI